MPTDPALTAWIPPEGCDVLRPTVGGGRAPAVFRPYQHSRHDWRPRCRTCKRPWPCPDAGMYLPRWSLSFSGARREALLLAHNDPVDAGMDAGRRVLGLGPLGIPLRSVEGYRLDNPRDLALLLQARIGGRAVFADASGEEVEP